MSAQATYRHATVMKDGFTVPMIGIPETSVLEECDCCHSQTGIGSVRFNGVQMLCGKCESESEKQT